MNEIVTQESNINIDEKELNRRIKIGDKNRGKKHGPKPQHVKDKISKATQIAFKCYNDLLSFGVAPEQARMILPQNLLTVFYASVDLNNLLKFIELRIAPEAQREIRVFAEAIKAILEEKLPEFMKIYNEERKAKND